LWGLGGARYPGPPGVAGCPDAFDPDVCHSDRCRATAPVARRRGYGSAHQRHIRDAPKHAKNRSRVCRVPTRLNVCRRTLTALDASQFGSADNGGSGSGWVRVHFHWCNAQTCCIHRSGGSRNLLESNRRHRFLCGGERGVSEWHSLLCAHRRPTDQAIGGHANAARSSSHFLDVADRSGTANPETAPGHW
jgi:hypothetical protein